MTPDAIRKVARDHGMKTTTNNYHVRFGQTIERIVRAEVIEECIERLIRGGQPAAASTIKHHFETLNATNSEQRGTVG